MIDIIEIMEMFNLDEKPYVQLGCVWCRDDFRITFIEDGVVYDAVQGDLIGESGGVVCLMNDVQQFLGWQPVIFSSNLGISPEEFEKTYEELM